MGVPESFTMRAMVGHFEINFGLTNGDPYCIVRDKSTGKVTRGLNGTKQAEQLLDPILWPAFAVTLLDETVSSDEFQQERLF